MKNIQTVGVLIFNKNKILLVKHGEKAGHPTGTYGLPAGKIDKSETSMQAAVRELKEETGLVATEENLEKLPITIPPANLIRKDGTTKRFQITLFLCRKYSGEMFANDETIPEWVAISELDNYPLVGYTKKK